MALNDQETSTIKKQLGNTCSALATTVARLYHCSPGGNDWTFEGIQGGIMLVVDRSLACKPKFINIYDLETFELKFRQELYDDMEYIQLTPFFYAFEVDDGVVGLCFADVAKAKTFCTKVNSNISGSKHNRSKSVSEATPSKSLFSRFKAFIMGDDDDEIEEISTPTNFVHRQHIGYDPEKGFEVRDIPDQWKGLFKKVGIKKRDLKNPETAKIIFNTVQTEMNKKQTGRPPPPQRISRPPPADPTMGGGTIPIPPTPGNIPLPPPTLNLAAAPPRPPLETKTESKIGGHPPPPPPNLMKRNEEEEEEEFGEPDNDESQQTDHLAAIRQGIKLKKVEAKAPPKSGREQALPDLGDADQMDMAEALRRAMASRRMDVEVAQEADDNDDWSD